jgi:hypothetical protein
MKMMEVEVVMTETVIMLIACCHLTVCMQSQLRALVAME